MQQRFHRSPSLCSESQINQGQREDVFLCPTARHSPIGIVGHNHIVQAIKRSAVLMRHISVVQALKARDSCIRTRLHHVRVPTPSRHMLPRLPLQPLHVLLGQVPALIFDEIHEIVRIVVHFDKALIHLWLDEGATQTPPLLDILVQLGAIPIAIEIPTVEFQSPQIRGRIPQSHGRVECTALPVQVRGIEEGKGLPVLARLNVSEAPVPLNVVDAGHRVIAASVSPVRCMVAQECDGRLWLPHFLQDVHFGVRGPNTARLLVECRIHILPRPHIVAILLQRKRVHGMDMRQSNRLATLKITHHTRDGVEQAAGLAIRLVPEMQEPQRQHIKRVQRDDLPPQRERTLESPAKQTLQCPEIERFMRL
mmetsp:Transcript_47835/g.79361  ORF Transcript_47835/g.79361 Transcript_47835/m.79361 type:complete len:366 (+) Transcript_47835:256-1353(+)